MASTDDLGSDHIGMVLRNHAAGSPRGGLRLVRAVVADVYRAGPGPFTLTVGLSLSGVALSLSQVLAGAGAVDALGAGGPDPAGLVVPLGTLAGLTIAALVVGAVGTQAQRLLGQVVLRDTERRILDVTTTVDLEAFETPEFVTLLTRIQHNAVDKPLEMVRGLLATGTGAAAAAAMTSVLLSVDPLLVPLLVIGALPILLVNRVGARREFAFATDQAAGLRERLHLADILQRRETAQEVRTFAVAPAVRRRWEDRYGTYLAGVRRLVVARCRLAAAGSLGAGVVLLGTLLWVGRQVQDGTLGLGQAAAALVAMRLLTARLQTLAGGASGLATTRLFVRDLHRFLAEARRPGPASAADPQVPMFSRLRVDGVSYRYPGSPANALDGVSLEIDRGAVVAVVGENGSGKTTLAKILAGLLDPTEGAVLWDGVKVSTLPPPGIRRHVSVVFQDFARFQLSARDNIAMGRDRGEPDEEAIREAAARAGAADVVASLPAGYDTVLSPAIPGGVDLSVGQWQRMALARAAYRDADFVLLDEPTSALDPKAERALFTRMREVFSGRTVVLISHRFSSVRDADAIVVMAAGRVVESGTHAGLMRAGGRYAEMFTAQASGYRTAW